MTGKLVCLVRSDMQINAYTTHGTFKSDEQAKVYVEEILEGEVGSLPGQWRILTIKKVV